MTISPHEATVALDQIERTGRRTMLAGGYRIASGPFLIWGVIWAVGYTLSGLLPPERWGLVWLPLIAIGSVASAVIGRTSGSPQAAARASRGTQSLRAPGAMVAIALFMAASYTLFRPATTEPYLVFPALVMAVVYTLVGLVTGALRFAAIGLGVFAVTVIGYAIGGAPLPFWLAAAGGGGLLLGGLWLRRP